MKIILNWQKQYEAVIAFKMQNNNKFPSVHKTSKAEKQLANWLRNNRAKHIQGSLSKECMSKLLAIDYMVNTNLKKRNGKKSTWDIKYDALIQFIQQNNNTWPQKNVNNNAERYLAIWLINVRHLHKKGKLQNHWVEKLEAIGYSFAPNTKGELGRKRKTGRINEALYNLRYNNIVQFKQQNNKWPLRRSKDEYEKKLGIWLANLRIACSKNKLLPEWKKKFEAIGYSFEFNYSNNIAQKRAAGIVQLLSFDEKLQKLIEFRKVSPHKWPTVYKSDAQQRLLANWLQTMKTYYKHHKLKQEWIDKLQATGYNLNSGVAAMQQEKTRRYIEKCQKLIAFRTSNPHKWPAKRSKNIEESRLARWAEDLQLQPIQQLLPLEWKQKLEAVGFVFKYKT